MNNDSKARDASNRVSRAIRKDRGAPGKNDYEHDDGSRVFETSDQIPRTFEWPAAKNPGADQVQLERHLNRGEIQGDLDAVERSSWPEAAELEASIMGNEPFRPTQGSGNVSTTSRAPRRPVPTPHGARSSQDR